MEFITEILNEIIDKICEEEEEIFKPIIGYEEEYEILTFGKMVSIKFNKRIIMKPDLNSGGYNLVKLSKNGITKGFLVSRLVGLNFIPNPENKPIVDHINENKTNNMISNLRWATNGQNHMNTKLSKNNTSGIKGVSFHKPLNKWIAHIMINGKNKHLGYFKKS